MSSYNRPNTPLYSNSDAVVSYKPEMAVHTDMSSFAALIQGVVKMANNQKQEVRSSAIDSCISDLRYRVSESLGKARLANKSEAIKFLENLSQNISMLQTCVNAYYSTNAQGDMSRIGECANNMLMASAGLKGDSNIRKIICNIAANYITLLNSHTTAVEIGDHHEIIDIAPVVDLAQQAAADMEMAKLQERITMLETQLQNQANTIANLESQLQKEARVVTKQAGIITTCQNEINRLNVLIRNVRVAPSVPLTIPKTTTSAPLIPPVPLVSSAPSEPSTPLVSTAPSAPPVPSAPLDIDE